MNNEKRVSKRVRRKFAVNLQWSDVDDKETLISYIVANTCYTIKTKRVMPSKI